MLERYNFAAVIRLTLFLSEMSLAKLTLLVIGSSKEDPLCYAYLWADFDLFTLVKHFGSEKSEADKYKHCRHLG